MLENGSDDLPTCSTGLNGCVELTDLVAPNPDFDSGFVFGPTDFGLLLATGPTLAAWAGMGVKQIWLSNGGLVICAGCLGRTSLRGAV